MGYHKPKHCKRCRARCETAYVKRWLPEKAIWTLVRVGYICFRCPKLFLVESPH